MIHVDPTLVASSPAPAGAQAADAPSDGPRTLVERQVAMLTRLAEMGMEIAEAATRAATAGDTPEHAFRGDPALAYTRVARAVRMTIALQSQLMKDLAALDTADAATAKARADRRRVGVQRLINEALSDTERFDGRPIHRLMMEASERLFDADVDAEIRGLSFAEIVARICDDLGLSPESTAQIVTAAGGTGAQSPSGSSLASPTVIP